MPTGLLILKPATTAYYVSSSGDDANDGRSTDQAWETLTKVNATSFSGGESILFNKGDEFEGTITISDSGTNGLPITYGSYGTGSKPKIYGSEEITGWSVHSGNIYKATFGTAITQLFIDDIRIRPARYPNPGEALHAITTVNSTHQFVSTDLDGGIDYTNARLHIKTNVWRIDYRNVTTSSSQTLTIDGDELPYGGLEVGEEFFLVDNLAFLDQAGEWYSDGTTVYLWTPNGDTPDNYIIRGSTIDDGLTIENEDYVTIENLVILQHKYMGISADNTNHIIIDNVDVEYPEVRGIRVKGYTDTGDSYNTIKNCTVEGANYIGMSNSGGQNLTTDNIITNIGLFDNLGLYGATGTQIDSASASYGFSSGYGDYNIIEYNRFINIGYHGISFVGQYTSIKNNYIENSCVTTDDGGSIYTFGVTTFNDRVYNSIIDGNIIIGANDQAIYMDDYTNNVEIKNNIIIGSTEYGIFFHHGYENNANNNTLYNNMIGLRSSTDPIPSGKTQSTFTYNIVLGPPDVGAHSSLMALMDSTITPRTTFLDYNTYINHHYIYPFKDLDGYALRGFDSWKTAMNCDTNSTEDITEIGTREEFIFYNDTKVDKTIDLSGGTYQDIDNVEVTELVLTPFTSKILIKQ